MASSLGIQGEELSWNTNGGSGTEAVSRGALRRDREPMSKSWFQAGIKSRADHPGPEKFGVGRVRRKVSSLEVESRNWENTRHSTGIC